MMTGIALKKLVNAATSICGKTGGIRQHDRETWWWNTLVQNAINDKRQAFRKWQQSKSLADRDEYRLKNKEAKRQVMVA